MTEPKSKVITKSPLPRRAVTFAALGEVLEVEVGGAVFRWRRGECELLWHPGAHALVWFDANETGIKVDETVKIAAAKAAFERFNDRPAETLRRAKYPVAGQWRSYGRARRIDYWSDKWNDPASYTHTHGTGVVLYRQGPVAGPWLFVLRGGRLKCTRRGLVG